LEHLESIIYDPHKLMKDHGGAEATEDAEESGGDSGENKVLLNDNGRLV